MARLINEQVFTSKTGTGGSLQTNNTSHDKVVASVITTVGATPTMDIAIQGSVDGTTFEDLAGATATITTATTTILKPTLPNPWFPHYRLNISANTNVTVTSANLAVSGFPGVDGE